MLEKAKKTKVPSIRTAGGDRSAPRGGACAVHRQSKRHRRKRPWEKDHSVAQTGRQALNRASHECKVRQGQIIQQHKTRERLGNGIHGCDTHVGGRDIVDQLHFLLQRSHEPVHRNKWSNAKPDNTQPWSESEGHMTRDHKVTCNHTSS